MAKYLKITDAVEGHIALGKGKRDYFKTKDSSSPSGHSLLAQIEMTHSGIVTRNYGFYLPNRMKAGASSFTKDFNKPVIIGHDESADSKPIGRVVQADYVDTSENYKAQDRYLSNLFNFQDSDGSEKSNGLLDFVHHVINEYDGTDAYKGMGHLRGTVNITDAESIEAILDKRYLTVSTSMVSDSATCSICATDWVADGLCDHSRGQTYKDNVCVIIPGNMGYEHLGVVNSPADPHAHDFVIMGDTPQQSQVLQLNNSTENLYKTGDGYQLAANLFGWKDSALVPLSSDNDVDLIEVKNNIQKMENAMKTIEERIKDALDVKVEVYRFSNGDLGSKEVAVREYMEELDVEAVQTLVAQIGKMLETEDSAKVSDEDLKKTVDTYFLKNHELVQKDDTDLGDPVDENTDPDKNDAQLKDGKRSALPDKAFTGEVLYDDVTLYKGAGVSAAGPAKKKRKKKKSKKMSDAFKLEDGDEITFDTLKTEVDEIEKVKDHFLDSEEIVKLAELVALHKAGDALTVATFDWKDKTTEDIIKDYLEWSDSGFELTKTSKEDIYAKMKDHLEEDKVLSEEDIGKLKASDFSGGKGFFPVVDEDHIKAALTVLRTVITSDSVKGRILSSIYRKAKKLGLDLTDNFDSNTKPCNNNDSITTDAAIKAYEDAKNKLVEMGIEIPDISQVEVNDKDQEIDILEAQLEASNEELDSVMQELVDLKAQLVDQLATRAVDMKMLSGTFEIKDRATEIKAHKERTLDSLKDVIKDLSDQVKIESFVQNDGLSGTPTESVDDPTLKDSKDSPGVKTTNDKGESEDLYKIYDQYNRLVTAYGKKEADRWLHKQKIQKGNLTTID